MIYQAICSGCDELWQFETEIARENYLDWHWEQTDHGKAFRMDVPEPPTWQPRPRDRSDAVAAAAREAGRKYREEHGT